MSNEFKLIIMTPKGKALNEYIFLKKTQEECIGFIDGYDRALRDNFITDTTFMEFSVVNYISNYLKVEMNITIYEEMKNEFIKSINNPAT